MASPYSRRDLLKGAAPSPPLPRWLAAPPRRASPGRPWRPHRWCAEAGGGRAGGARRRRDGRDRQGPPLRRGLRPARARRHRGHDARHRLPHRVDDEGYRHGRGHAARRAGQAQARGARSPASTRRSARPRSSRASTPPAHRGAPGEGAITLRHLLTHTAGFSYDIWDPDTGRYIKATGMPGRATGKVASLRQPLVFDPGARWLYGINIEWTGRLIEAAQRPDARGLFPRADLRAARHEGQRLRHDQEQRARQARLHTRQPDGSLYCSRWSRCR